MGLVSARSQGGQSEKFLNRAEKFLNRELYCPATLCRMPDHVPVFDVRVRENGFVVFSFKQGRHSRVGAPLAGHLVTEDLQSFAGFKAIYVPGEFRAASCEFLSGGLRARGR